MENTLVKKKKPTKLQKEKSLKLKHESFTTCYHCDNKKLKFIENHRFKSVSDGPLETADVFFCPTCHCLAWEDSDGINMMYWQNIYNMEKWEKDRGIEPTKGVNWVSDQDLTPSKN